MGDPRGDPYYEPTIVVHDETNGHISVLSEIHILFPFNLILTSGPILIAKNHQRVVLS